MKIGLTSIFVSDPIEAFHYYTKVLGFGERMFIPEANIAIVVSKDDPNGTGLLLEPNENPLARTYQEGLYQAGIPVITMSSDDIRAEHEELHELGVKFTRGPAKTDWGIEAIFDDGFGNFIQLIQV